MLDAHTNRENVVTILIDLSFTELHSHAELCSLAKQSRCAYSSLLSSGNTGEISFGFLSYNSEAREALRVHSADNWAAERINASLGSWLSNERVSDRISNENLIYLSPDADNVLQSVDPGKIYVVAGIVDKTVKPGLSLKQAQKHDLRCARLPYGDLFPQAVKGQVLNIDTVVQVLAAFVACQEWSRAFEEVSALERK